MGGVCTQEFPAKGAELIFYRYTHDAWGRLVEVEYIVDTGVSQTVHTIAEHIYNGLSWRIRSNLDTSSPFDGTFEQRRVMYYNAAWQLVEELDLGATGGTGDDRLREYFYGADYIDTFSIPVRTPSSGRTRPRPRSTSRREAGAHRCDASARCSTLRTRRSR